jgi:hypothetical protein
MQNAAGCHGMKGVKERGKNGRTCTAGGILIHRRSQIQVQMISAYLRVLLAILFCACSAALCLSAPGRQYELVPQFDGKDLTRGNKRVLVTAPKGWESREYRGPTWPGFDPRDIDYSIAFARKGRAVGRPVIEIETNHIGHHYSAKVTPKNSYMGVNLNTDIKELKLIETFDAGVNGTLDVWRFRTYNRNYLLVLIVQPDTEGRTEVDAYLSADDVAQLMPYLNSLKEVARSIRIRIVDH